MIRDFKSKRIIDIKERMLVINKKIYARESYICFDTSSIKDYPPKIYYDRDDYYLGKSFDVGLYELDDIEDILSSYENFCFSNHDLDDLRKLLIKRREDFLEKIINSE